MYDSETFCLGIGKSGRVSQLTGLVLYYIVFPSHFCCPKSNNLEDVREEWERIKLSYEILSDKRTRRRYDRHAMVADPGPAIAKAALGVVGKGISGLGKGIFDIGLFAAQRMVHRGE